MAIVTVLGASGTISVPFKSDSNALLAQQLADQISLAINSGTLYAAPYNAPSLPVLPTVPGGASIGEQVIGGNSPSAPLTPSVQNPAGYPAIVVNASEPVTVTGAPSQTAPYSIIGGEGGLTFLGEGSSLGGSIFLGGGMNTVAGTTNQTIAPDSTNGGLIGDWTIGTVGTDAADSDLIRLASGNDTLTIGANDTISTGAANALITASNAPVIVFPGAGNVTFYGGSTSGDRVLANNITTGNDLIVLGSGGNGTVVAGTGNATLIGGGDGDVLFGDTGPVEQQLFAAGNETLMGGGASSDSFFGFSAADSVGNVAMSAGYGTGNNQFWVGAGNDTVWTGMGNDSVFVVADRTANSGSPANDIIYGWNSNNTMYLQGYSSQSFGGSALGVTLSLSDGTQITFAGISDPNSVKIV